MEENLAGAQPRRMGNLVASVKFQTPEWARQAWAGELPRASHLYLLDSFLICSSGMLLLAG